MIRLLITAIVIIGGATWLAQHYLGGSTGIRPEEFEDGNPPAVQQYRDNLNEALDAGEQRQQQAIDELEGRGSE